MNVLDLFSGIGGFSLGLERAGMRTVAFCEIEPFCRAVLKKHWPAVPCYDDVRTLTGPELAADGIAVDVICGGFPCQDISHAGKGAGIDGSRSGLWSEYARLIGELRPHYVVVENVSALLGRGLDRVLGDLAALRYDAEWHCIPACAAGAPHIRDRIWIVAYPDGSERGALGGARQRLAWAISLSQWQQGSGGLGPSCEAVADAAWDVRSEQEACGTKRQRARPRGQSITGADAHGAGLSPSGPQSDGANGQHGGRVPSSNSWWRIEPDVGRVAHGVPSRVDRLRSLGNAVVPQIPEIIGRAIMTQAKNALLHPPRAPAEFQRKPCDTARVANKNSVTRGYPPTL